LEISGTSVITITGYARKSKSSTADRKLGLERARATQKIMKTIAPKAKYVIVSKGSTYNAACKAFSNRCSVVTVQN
jgi:outer membrane protein OmpA-like peptidoglycan-associated protein